MAAVPGKHRLADALPVLAGKIHQLPQGFRLQMGLIAQHDAQWEIFSRQPVQFAAQTTELNIPRSGCGFSMRSEFGKFSRSSSVVSARSDGRWTTAICPAPISRHCAINCPMMVVSRHGNSSLGRPIRTDAPAARMTTPRCWWICAMPDFGASSAAHARGFANRRQDSGTGISPVPLTCPGPNSEELVFANLQDRKQFLGN